MRFLQFSRVYKCGFYLEYFFQYPSKYEYLRKIFMPISEAFSILIFGIFYASI